MEVRLDNRTKFIYSTSGSQSSIVKYNEGFQKLGLNLVYHTFDNNSGGVIDAKVYAGCLRGPHVLGGAVTAHDGLKSKIIPYLDVVDPLALKCRAVNTVVNVRGCLQGYNTDVFGLHRALMKGLNEYCNNRDKKSGGIEIRTAAIYGNGGVSGVAWHVLNELQYEYHQKQKGNKNGVRGWRNIQVTILGRNPAKVAAKRKELGIVVDHRVENDEGPYDLVVDATPLASMQESEWPPLYKKICSEAKIVFCHSMPEKDKKVNYLKRICDQNRVRFIPGSWMHSAQMVKQYSLYFSALADANNVHDEFVTPDNKNSSNSNNNKKRKRYGEITEEDICKTWNLDLP